MKLEKYSFVFNLNNLGKIIIFIFLFFHYVSLKKYCGKNYQNHFSKNPIKLILKTNLRDIKNNNNSLIKVKSSHHFEYEKSSRDYWEKRYAEGGNSGKGSYNHLAQFKASVLNNFVTKNKIDSVIEWGSGDCNQLSFANYKKYIGYDVSRSAINICKKKFYNDSTKNFIYLSKNYINHKKADLSLSLDVIFHLFEDNVFDIYMKNLFNSSNKYVCIYSSNFEKEGLEKHVRHRKFTEYIDKYLSNDWKLKIYIPNKYRYGSKFNGTKSLSDFYIYEKVDYKNKF